MPFNASLATVKTFTVGTSPTTLDDGTTAALTVLNVEPRGVYQGPADATPSVTLSCGTGTVVVPMGACITFVTAGSPTSVHTTAGTASVAVLPAGAITTDPNSHVGLFTSDPVTLTHS